MILAPIPTPAPSAVPSLAPSPVPTFAPTLAPIQPVDVLRDAWDWLAVVGSLAFGAASVTTGIIAVVLAIRATRAAERANHEAVLARAAVAKERRRTFDLEVLRDLLEAVDDPQFIYRVSEAPGEIGNRFASRLAMLPREDLASWRSIATVGPMELIDFMGGPDEEDQVSINRMVEQGYRSSGSLRTRLRERLRTDIEAAVERRMSDRDD